MLIVFGNGSLGPSVNSSSKGWYSKQRLNKALFGTKIFNISLCIISYKHYMTFVLAQLEVTIHCDRYLFHYLFHYSSLN